MAKKWMTFVAALFAALVAQAQSQTTTKTNDFVSFDNIEVSDDFEVTYQVSDAYKVVWTYDTVLSDLISVYVTGQTLYVDFNRKGMSSELKKTYTGRKAPKPVLKATVYAPFFSGLTLNDNAVFNGNGGHIDPARFTLVMTGKTKLSDLIVDADVCSVTAGKDANATLTVNAEEISIKTEKSALVNMVLQSDRLNIDASGSSAISLTGDTGDIVSTSQNSAKVSMNGSAETIRHDGKGTSELDLISAPLQTADLVMANASKIYVNVYDTLKVDLKGNSSVIFDGKPQIEVVNIISSTLMHYTGSKRR